MREALANVARHARARRVDVSLDFQDKALQLCISDDGVGMVALPIDNKGYGLRNIRERTRLLEGTLDMHAAPNKGVTLVFTIPY
jgi:signal transduction histidine kinase